MLHHATDGGPSLNEFLHAPNRPRLGALVGAKRKSSTFLLPSGTDPFSKGLSATGGGRKTFSSLNPEQQFEALHQIAKDQV